MAADRHIVLLTTERLRVTQLPPDGAARVVAYYEANRDHLGPVSPTRPAHFYTLTYWRTRLAQDLEDARFDMSLRLVVLPREEPLSSAPVIGNISLTNIVRGPLQAVTLGYGLDHRHEGRGLMTEALRAVCAHAFTTMGLHRIQANHLPENLRSAAVLRRLGFTVEGYARDFLRIDGRWRDHILTALVAPEGSPTPAE
ncbi:GNAT family N-acetyltransferase [Myxococcus qinghaiensis]|uniref:GNAT family N-acetyltransferase n=1 Tax=Myxococcus qinghaiensis TaxID=2906758 RepID=UPI0020A81342|nr:GNAT family N-acetyltransferase [Myxococcus qinghaiensis]MCP3163237.1 GNAT family N-acetyltransferase [Myxococcus qinghaiensis]